MHKSSLIPYIVDVRHTIIPIKNILEELLVNLARSFIPYEHIRKQYNQSI